MIVSWIILLSWSFVPCPISRVRITAMLSVKGFKNLFPTGSQDLQEQGEISLDKIVLLVSTVNCQHFFEPFPKIIGHRENA